jgi:hypothetical protein
VEDKITVAQSNGDFRKVGFNVSGNLWKTLEGLYAINSTVVPASTSALRRISKLSVLPPDFARIWDGILLGDLEERTENMLLLMRFVLARI